MTYMKFIFYSLVILSIGIAFGCKASKKAVETPTEDNVEISSANSMDKGKVMVLLQRGISPKALEDEFKAYEFYSKGLVSRRENRCIFTFNPSLIDADELLAKIKALPIVEEAEFPKVTKKPKVSKGN